MGANNKNFHKAKKAKNDEFYTQLSDIEKELKHYKEHFKDKVVFCNCDDPTKSNFWRYFALSMEHLGIKKLVTTHYDSEKPTYKLELYREDIKDSANPDQYAIKTPLKQNGDFRSSESIEILKSADIVVTNPPFSLFREYVAQLVEYEKKFIIIGNNNAITYKEIFGLIKDGKLWLGHHSNKTMEFKIPDHYKKWNRIDEKTGQKYGKVPACSWFTNLKIKKREEWLELVKTYKGNEDKYPHYDNYDAINVDKVVEIPADYKGYIGVPITFLDKYNPKQFKIVDSNTIIIGEKAPLKKHGLIKDKDGAIQGKPKYARIVIKQKECIQ